MYKSNDVVEGIFSEKEWLTLKEENDNIDRGNYESFLWIQISFTWNDVY